MSISIASQINGGSRIMIIKQKDLYPEDVEKVSYYKKMDLNEILKISAKWACGSNEKYLSNLGLHPTEFYSLFWVECKELINTIEFEELDGVNLNPKLLFNDINERDCRVVKVLDHWRNGGYIDPPVISINRLNKIWFADGRHRTIAAFHIGEEKIPIIFEKSKFKNISLTLSLFQNCL
jgi:hypothetical protein